MKRTRLIIRQLLFLPMLFLFCLTSNGQKSESFVDQRDGKKYKTVKIGKQVWMAENLNYDAGFGCWCYNKNVDNCERYGHLYKWKKAKIACPDGWHLPSKNELETLLNNFGGPGKKAFSALKKGGSSDFAASMGGLRIGLNFSGIDDAGFFWSSSEYIGNYGILGLESTEGGERFYHLNFSADMKSVYLQHSNKREAFSVRCVKD